MSSKVLKELKAMIHEQKLQIQALQHSLELSWEQAAITKTYLDSLLTQLPENIYWIDKQGKFLFCNQLLLQSFGIKSITELIGKDILKIGKSLGWNRIVSETIHQFTIGVIQSGKIKRTEIASTVNKKDKIFLASIMPFYDDSNNIIGALTVLTDITEQKELEYQLKSAEKHASNESLKFSIYLDNILANVPEILYWMDKNEVVLGCNDHQAHSFGLKDKSEVIGKSISELAKIVGWDQSMVDSLHQNNMEIMKSGKGKVIEEKAVFYGELKTFLSYKNPLFNKNKEVIGIFGISVDITERKKLENELLQAKEAAEAANRAKTEFLMNMSHDLRTPLNGILGFTQILSAQEKDPVKSEYMNYLLSSAKHLFSLFNELIDLTYSEQHLTINKTNFDIRTTVKELQELLLPEIKHKGINFDIRIGKNIPDEIYSDKMRLNRIILNLLGNAIKFTSQGSVSLEIKLNKGMLVINISDTGIGIPPEKLDAIFEKFTRLTFSQQETYKGFGLGLHIVKKFVQELGGSIKVKSKLNEGSSFICAIPF